MLVVTDSFKPGPHLQVRQLLCKGLWYGIRLLLHPGPAFLLQSSKSGTSSKRQSAQAVVCSCACLNTLFSESLLLQAESCSKAACHSA